MSSVAQAKTWTLIKRILQLVLLVAVASAVIFLTGPKFGRLVEALTPPELRPVNTELTPKRLDQNWPQRVSARFHSISQGTRTLPVPLSWLEALEEPHGSLLAVPFARNGLFLRDEYFLRFGFIKGEKSEFNPAGLPVGVTPTPAQKLPGISDIQTAVGLTCAACHTGQITYNDTLYLIEGGPAVTDLGLLTKALGAALGQTALSAKIPIFDGRFERFARAVLKEAYSDGRKLALLAELESLLAYLASQPGDVDVVEGFARLDALNRIGNQVFAQDNNRPENYVPIDAPVNYPHIWTASWFDWVQYDASIMAPLVRNAGEALGVSAYLNTTAPDDEFRFASSIDYKNLIWIEEALSGPPPAPAEKLQGLLSPSWPAEFPKIDEAMAAQGRTLYADHCQGCHRPPVGSPEFWDFFYYIIYGTNGEKQSLHKVLEVKAIPIWQIGTDPAQADVLINRTVNTAGDDGGTGMPERPGMGLDTEVCAPKPQLFSKPDVGYQSYEVETRLNDYRYSERQALVPVPVRDGAVLSFGLALGALVQEADDAWFDQNYIPPDQRVVYERGRPNCLRPGAGYKARPLNGVWATAPFLHNGSVPTLHDLLSPQEKRPRYVQLGSTAFDPVNVGVRQDPGLQERILEALEDDPTVRYVDGFFVLDTEIPGNLNTGHEFSSRYREGKEWYEQPTGVIGPELTDDERMALIEFLKTQ